MLINCNVENICLTQPNINVPHKLKNTLMQQKLQETEVDLNG